MMKGAVSKNAGFSVWQKGFYDHVIRGEQDYLDVWNYIEKEAIEIPASKVPAFKAAKALKDTVAK